MVNNPIYYSGIEELNRERKQGHYNYNDDKNYYKIVINDHIKNRYQILKKLGKGSFGTVVLGFDHKYSSLHAIKIIRNESRFIKTTNREIKFLEELKGSNYIIKLEKEFEYNNHICLVFEYFGSDLYQKYIKKKTFIEYNLLLKIIYQIADGLKYIHNKKIIHLDLKPENILILGSNIKIIDFGSSKKTTEKINSFYVQSRWYRSPEALLEIKYNQKVDIWSFGCMIYELFMTEPLFPGKNTTNQIYYIYSEFGKYPSIYNSKYLCNGVPISVGSSKFVRESKMLFIEKNKPQLHNIIMKCLSVDFKDRCDANEILEDSLFKQLT